jgi:hypothetical protein
MAAQVQNANVRTFSATIKTVQINHKQMTLAVFRQLVNEAIWDTATRTLRGSPWGLVNYFWQDCGSMVEPHMHVVWQNGADLRRTCFSPTKGELFRYSSEHTTLMEKYDRVLDIIGEAAIIRAVLDGAVPKTVSPSGSSYSPGLKQLQLGEWVRDMSRFEETIRRAGLSPQDAARYGCDVDQARADLTYSLEAMRLEIDALPRSGFDEITGHGFLGQNPQDADFKRAREAVEAQKKEYSHAWSDVVCKIRSLDQLFIAV